MCGIVGFIGEDREKIERLTACLKHRGPDGNGVYVGNGVSFGHARLAILDPSPAANQPMWNESKTVVMIYNGEIFNYRRLREEEGFQCKTGSDTEVLLKLYEVHGIRFVERLIGMFAFALYDTKTRELYLVRDSHGIKPLYITRVGDALCFASEMRTLMKAHETKPLLDTKALSHFLTFQYVPGPRTLVEGVESLPPGTILRLRDGTEHRELFTQLCTQPTLESKEQFRKEFPTWMQQVVEDHTISDKPVGVFLSGGMDSSIVLHHMAHARTTPVKTFTVRFDATEEEDAARFNKDADLALLTAKHYGTDHEELMLTANMYRDLYRETAFSLDLPNSDSVSVAQYALARMAKKKVDVVLSGAGGDELFGGYPRYRVFRGLKAIQWIPSGLRGLAARILGYPKDVLRLSPGPALALRLLGRSTYEVSMVTKRDWFDPEASEQLMEERFDRFKALDDVRRMMEVDRSLWLVDESLKLSDAVTMAHGLECRVPFIDPRTIAWSHAVPSHWHVGFSKTKALLKETYRPILPAHLFTLPKASFYPPLAKWIRRESAPLVEEALEGKRIQEFFNVKYLRKIFELHKTKERYSLHQLSNIMQLHYWFETVYDA